MEFIPLLLLAIGAAATIALVLMLLGRFFF